MSFKNICLHDYHLETLNKCINEFLIITFIINCVKKSLEKLFSFLLGLYYTWINESKNHVVCNIENASNQNFTIWHEWLSHLGISIMRQIINNCLEHKLKSVNISSFNKYTCVACAESKLIIRLLMTKS